VARCRVPDHHGAVITRDANQHFAGPNVPPAGHVIDNSVWESLLGRHACFAERNGRAVRYQPDVAPFIALEDVADPRAWQDAAELVGPHNTLTLVGVSTPPEGWAAVSGFVGVQMVDTALRAVPDPQAVELGPEDVPEILDLVERTNPGPFRDRTIEMGTYLGIRRDGRLVAMAGERQHPPGWTEISAVCTDGAHRGQGLATRLVRAVAAGIRERGETPFLHALAENADAIRLYESIGFTLRRRAPINTFKRL
jgi:ribosomal protein S18 acetylase RimI-like enzyme